MSSSPSQSPQDCEAHGLGLPSRTELTVSIVTPIEIQDDETVPVISLPNQTEHAQSTAVVKTAVDADEEEHFVSVHLTPRSTNSDTNDTSNETNTLVPNAIEQEDIVIRVAAMEVDEIQVAVSMDSLPSIVLSRQSSHHDSDTRYQTLLCQLEEMGFPHERCVLSLKYCQAESLEAALELLLPGLLPHDCIAEGGGTICIFCGQSVTTTADPPGTNFVASPSAEEEVEEEEERVLQRQRELRDRYARGLLFASVPAPPSIQQVTSWDSNATESCLICFDMFTPEQVQILSCNDKVCRECLIGYLNTKISDAQVLKIQCPASCGGLLSDVFIKSLVTEETFTKMEKFRDTLRLQMDPSIRWCPTPDCGSYMRGSDSRPKLQCPKCSFVLCFKCNSAWHPKKKCEEVMDEGYNAWAKGKNVQTCPRCRSRVEKIAGCNHMTCSRCAYQWCWLCRARYTGMHYAPFNPFGCPGLQTSSHSTGRWPTGKRFLLRLCVLCVCLLAIPLAILCLFSCLVVHSVMDVSLRFNIRQKLYRRGKCYRVGVLTLIFIAAMPFNVFFLPLVVIVGIPWLLHYSCRSISRWRQRRRTDREILGRLGIV